MVPEDEIETVVPRPPGGHGARHGTRPALLGSRLLSGRSLAPAIRKRAAAEGFDDCGILRLVDNPQAAQRLRDFVSKGRHGDMGWLADTLERRSALAALWPEARSAVVLAMNYGPERNPMARLSARSAGNISVHALNRDYHALIKGRLKNMAQWLARQSGGEVKVFVDTAPLMEKPLAQQAGLGWQGRHTNLVSRRLGSWFFIGTILTSAELPPDAAETDRCGTCRACLDVCPTDAFPAPYQLDARRCISYLTIEYKGHIAPGFREAMGNRIYGCDDCLAVCPWNKFAKAAAEAKLAARADITAPPLGELLALDDAAFRHLFSGSPVKRIGRDRFIRNALIAAGNSGDASLCGAVTPHLDDPAPIVRAMAIWALSRISSREAFLRLRQARASAERDFEVRAEWEAT